MLKKGGVDKTHKIISQLWSAKCMVSEKYALLAQLVQTSIVITMKCTSNSKYYFVPSFINELLSYNFSNVSSNRHMTVKFDVAHWYFKTSPLH